MMKIVILGAGKTGSFAAATLSQEGHDVTIVDKNATLLEKLNREFDLSTRCALIPSLQLFEDLLETRPDLLLAVTGEDETNLVSCTIAKNLGFPKTVALVHSREFINHTHLDFGRLFFVDYFLAAELLAAQDLFKILIHTDDVAVEHFAHGAIEMRTITIPERWDKGHIPLKALPFPEEFIIGLLRRRLSDGEQILFPHGDDHLLPGDEITAVGEADVMNHLHELFQIPQHPIRSVILVGGSSVAFHLAYFLTQQRISIRIIERDLTRCEELADLLPTATILHRDGADSNFLQRERVQEADALVSCTASDATNLLIASLAKEAGCKKVIALATDPTLRPILERLHIIPALSARLNVANRLLSIINEKSILSVASVCHDKAKIVEIKIPAHSRAVGIPLADLSARLPKDLLVAVIENQGRVMIGRGNRILCPGDTVIALCAPRHLPHLQSLF